jgi:hypothetical protein
MTLDRYNRWIRLHWWPWVSLPALATAVALAADPTTGGPATLAWVVLSVAVPIVVSVVAFRVSRRHRVA